MTTDELFGELEKTGRPVFAGVEGHAVVFCDGQRVELPKGVKAEMKSGFRLAVTGDYDGWHRLRGVFCCAYNGDCTAARGRLAEATNYLTDKIARHKRLREAK